MSYQGNLKVYGRTLCPVEVSWGSIIDRISSPSGSGRERLCAGDSDMRIFAGIVAFCILTMCFIAPAAAENIAVSSIQSNEPLIGMPNPAAVWADEMGYEYVIRTDGEGNQYGVCILPDGTEADAWELFRAAHPPEDPTVNEMRNPAEIWASELGYESFSLTSDQMNRYRIGVSPAITVQDAWRSAGDSTGSVMNEIIQSASISYRSGSGYSVLISDRLSDLA